MNAEEQIDMLKEDNEQKMQGLFKNLEKAESIFLNLFRENE